MNLLASYHLRFSSTLKPSFAPPISLKRGSMFYIKYAFKRQPLSLVQIYRRYLKQSLKLYKICDKNIGLYLLKLVSSMRKQGQKQWRKVGDITNLISEITNHKKLIKDEQKDQQDRNSQDKQSHPTTGQSPQYPSSTQEQVTSSPLIKLHLQKSNREHLFRQHVLQRFQSLHYLSISISQSLDLSLQSDLVTKQQTKLIKLCLNISQFFAHDLNMRPDYHSLVLLDFLQDDMEYQVLGVKDKQFVKNVINRVCGYKKSNHSRFKSISDYLKDPNAILYQTVSGKIQLKPKPLMTPKKNKLWQKQQITSQQQRQLDDQEKQRQNQWVLMSQQERDQIVRDIVLAGQTETKWGQERVLQDKVEKQRYQTDQMQIEGQQNQEKYHQYPLLKTLNELHQPEPKIKQEIYKIVRRLFKLPSSQPVFKMQESSKPHNQAYPQIKANSGEQNAPSNPAKHNQVDKKDSSSFMLLQDMINENQFLDQIVNKKRIIIV